MKAIVLILAMVSLAIASPNKHAYGGVPSKEKYLERLAYIAQYDSVRRVTNWVAYHVDPTTYKCPRHPDGSTGRYGKYASYRNDPDVGNELKKYNFADQHKTWRNYETGHLVPWAIACGDYDGDGKNYADGDKDEFQAFKEINYYTNMTHQHGKGFNGAGGIWYKIENYVREKLIKKGKKVWIFAGPVFGKTPYDVYRGVEVPAMYFKIVITEENGKPNILAFLLPHRMMGQKKNQSEADFLVSVNHIESMTGLDFFPEINNDSLERFPTFKNWKD